MLINVKMSTIVGILTFMRRINFVLSWVEYEKSFITSGQVLLDNLYCNETFYSHFDIKYPMTNYLNVRMFPLKVSHTVSHEMNLSVWTASGFLSNQYFHLEISSRVNYPILSYTCEHWCFAISKLCAELSPVLTCNLFDLQSYSHCSLDLFFGHIYPEF